MKLGDLCDVITKGTTPTSVGFKFESDGVNFVKVESLTSNNDFIPAKFAKISPECNESLKRSQLQKGDILFSIAGALGRTAIVSEDILPANTNQALAIIRLKPNIEIDTRYLLYTLNSDTTKEQSERNKGGVAQQNLSLTQLKNYDVYLPPITEQQRIVAKLDAAFAEIDKIATNTQEKLEEAQKLYASGITDIYFSNKSVPVVPLSTISKIKGGKRLPKGNKLQPEPTKYPYIRVSDFTDYGTIDEKSIKYITEEIHSEISRYTISSDDVYVSIAGTIGKTGIIPQSLDGANLTENAAKIMLNEECDKDYFYFFTTSSSFKKQAIAQTRTAAQPKLALERLGAVELPIHNKLSQQAIAEKACSVRDKVRLVEMLLSEKLVQIQVLKSAILKQELQSSEAA